MICEKEVQKFRSTEDQKYRRSEALNLKKEKSF
jgi:hypothetical protein